MKDKDKVLFLLSVLRVFFWLFGGAIIAAILGIYDFGGNVESVILTRVVKVVYTAGGQFVFLYFQSLVILKLICRSERKKKYYLVSLLIVFSNLLVQLLLNDGNLNFGYTISNIVILLGGIMLMDRKIPWRRTIFVFGVNLFYQLMVLFLRDISYNGGYDAVRDFLLQVDYLILLIITYALMELVGNEYLWGLLKCQYLSRERVKYFFGRRIKVKKKRFGTKEERQEQVSEMIYLVLVIIWNLFTLGCVAFICTLNTTLVTTVFLLVSFMMTKSTFSEAFHMKRALSCFVVSNLIYFVLSRITVRVEISFLVPIILGVSLSYVSSLFVRKKEPEEPARKMQLYRGMSEDEVLDICAGGEFNGYEIGLLVDFYCKRMTLVQLALKYNYSKDTIYYHKKKVLEKIQRFGENTYQ